MKKESVGQFLQSMKNSTENFIEELNILEDQINKIFIFNEYGLVGGICALIALLIASHQIIMHLYFFNNQKLQTYIVRILLMVPVKAIFIILINLRNIDLIKIKDLFCPKLAFVDFSKIL